METIIFSIIGWIITIFIAVYTVRSSAKDTAKQIAALEESTKKQVESIKKLAVSFIEVNALQIEKELWDARHCQRQYCQEVSDDFDTQEEASRIGIPVDKYSSIVKGRKEFERKSDFIMKKMDTLKSIRSRLDVLKKNMGGE